MLQDHGLFRIQGNMANSLPVFSAPSVPLREKIRFSPRRNPPPYPMRLICCLWGASRFTPTGSRARHCVLLR